MILYNIVKEEKIIVKWQGEISILKIIHMKNESSKSTFKFIEGECQNFIPAFYDFLENHPELDQYMCYLCPEAVVISDNNGLYKFHYGLNIRNNELYKVIKKEYSPKTPAEKLLCEMTDF